MEETDKGCDRYRGIFEYALDGMFIIDLKGRYRDVNPAGCAMFGFTRDEFLASNITLLLFPEDVERSFRIGEKDWRSGAFVPEYRMRKRDGAELWVEMTVKPIKGADNEDLVLGIKRDITGRRKKDETLRTLYSAIEQSPSSVIICDTFGRIEYVNPRFTEDTGYALEEIKGKGADDIGCCVHPGGFYEDLRQTVASGRAWRGDICSRKKNGEPLWELRSISPLVDASGRVTHIVSVKIDDMERRKAEEALRASEELFRQLAGSVREVFILADPGFRRVFYVSPAYEEIWGRTSRSLLADPSAWTEAIHPDDVMRVVEKRRLIGEGFSEEYRIRRPDGGLRWIQARMFPVRDASGEIYRIAGVARDITEKKKMEGEILKARKLESIGLLAGGIAHDFNNLLNGIFGNITIARLHLDPNDRASAILEDAEKVLNRAKDLTHQLLTFSRGGTPVKKTISAAGVVRDSAQFAASGTGVRCELSIPEDLWTIDADEGQISQVITNMAINAHQAMPDGGVMRISASNAAMGPSEVGALKEGDYIIITIEDEGAGIAEENIQKIFDPYFTTKKKSSGLGLAVSYSIVKNHGGLITADSKGKGATFRIYLPASKRKIHASERPERPAGPSKGKVLVMDDEEMIRKVVGTFLANFGFEAAFAADGAEAVELYARALQQGSPFDAVIMDLTVPAAWAAKRQ